MTQDDASSESISPVQTGFLIAVGAAALSGVYLQPMLLGELLADGRLTAAGLGRAATAELITLGLGAVAAGAILKPVGLRRICALTAIALIAVNLLTMVSAGWGVIGARALAGLFEGILMWMPVAAIAQSSKAGRLTAIFAMVTTIVPSILAVLLPFLTEGVIGTNGGYLVLAALASCAALSSRAIPDTLSIATGKGVQTRSPLKPAGYMVLLAGLVLTAASGAEWTYLAPLAAEAGHPVTYVALSVSIGLLAQVCAGLAAVMLVERLPLTPTLILSALGLGAGLATLYSLPSAPIFVSAVAVCAFLAQFLIPFEVVLAVRTDPSRRTAMFLPGMNMIGGAAGPLLGSLLVTEHSAREAIVGAAFPLLIGITLIVILAIRHMRIVATGRFVDQELVTLGTR